jgi:hypothetical protein
MGEYAFDVAQSRQLALLLPLLARCRCYPAFPAVEIRACRLIE